MASRRYTGLRYREDVGVEFRCPECRTFWPLDREFWDFRAFGRCKACCAKAKRASDREAYRTNPELRARRLEYQRTYRSEARRVKAVYSFERYWSDPAAARQKSKDRYYRDRDAILERKRAAYAARKAA